MPELPEAETIARGLRARVVDRTITGVEVLKDDLLATPAESFVGTLTGGTVREIGRRGKNLVLSIEAGHARNARLVINLGMSGRLLRAASGDSHDLASHPGVRFWLSDGAMLVYDDVRRFGRLAVLTPEAYRSWSASMGPEPLSRRFTGRALAEALARSASPIRSWLLDQRRIAGIGNIYANEALFEARVHPRRPAKELTADEGRRLHRAIRAVLRAAVDARGTTLRDYRTAEGWEGSYAGALRVYGREGRPCGRCRRAIERLSFGGRSAYFCPRCQPPSG